MRLWIASGNMAQHFQRLALPKRPRRQRSPAASSDVLKHYNDHENPYASTSAPALDDSTFSSNRFGVVQATAALFRLQLSAYALYELQFQRQWQQQHLRHSISFELQHQCHPPQLLRNSMRRTCVSISAPTLRDTDSVHHPPDQRPGRASARPTPSQRNLSIWQLGGGNLYLRSGSSQHQRQPRQHLRSSMRSPSAAHLRVVSMSVQHQLRPNSNFFNQSAIRGKFYPGNHRI